MENLVVVRQKSLVVRRVLVALKAQTSSDYNRSKARASGLPENGGRWRAWKRIGQREGLAPMRKEVWEDDMFFFWKGGCNIFKFYVISQSYVYICCLCMFFFFGEEAVLTNGSWKKKPTTQRRHFDKLDKVLRCLDWWQVIPLMASRNPAG